MTGSTPGGHVQDQRKGHTGLDLSHGKSFVLLKANVVVYKIY